METSSTLDISSEERRKSARHFSLNYVCSQENLDDIPHPDDSFQKQKSLNMLLYNDEKLELPPLPPKTIHNKLQTVTDCSLENTSNPSLCNSDDLIPFANIPLPEDFSFQFTPPLPRSDNHEISSEIKDQISQDCECPDSSSRYSPSKIDSDEENQYFMTAKPKVLGKEQAKKRLMAFSLSKQQTALVKKQSKIAPSPKNIKEKPPNPNKSSGVQDQFRATISEIEEEKKKMWQNMPNYLLLEMNDLVKSTHPILTPLKSQEKQKSESKDTPKKDENSNKNAEDCANLINKDLQKGKNSSKSYRRTRSRSRDRKHRGKSRDSSKSKRRSRSRSKSKSKSLSKTSKHKISRQDLKDNNISLKSKTFYENWKCFKDSGFTGANDVWSSVFLENEIDEEKDRDHGRLLLINDDKWYYKPVFNYLKKEHKLMKSFQAKPVNSRTDNLPLYLEKTIKYTRTKPSLIWSENSSLGTDFYMSKSMLLDNCDPATADIISVIINNKKIISDPEDLVSTNTSNTRKWYPCTFETSQAPIFNDDFEIKIPQNYEKLMIKTDETCLTSYLGDESQKRKFETKMDDELEEACMKKNKLKDEDRDKTSNIEGSKVSLVNDSYLSDEEGSANKIKEMVVGNVKVQMNLDRNCIKVRSRWDSDYENENSEKDDCHKEDDMDLATPEPETDSNLEKNFVSSSCSYENPTLMPQTEKEESDVANKSEIQSQGYNDKAGNLASEYEEFLKMVSFDCKVDKVDEANDNKEKVSENDTKSEKQKTIKEESQIADAEIQKSKFEITEWDKDSDHEEKPVVDKVNYKKSESENDLLSPKDEKVKLKPKKMKKKMLAKKKKEKFGKKEKLSKKNLKGKKKKRNSSSSSDSSSDSGDTESDSNSDSDSDSDESTSPKRRKKKTKRNKKKNKKISSSESESQSESESESGSESDSDSDSDSDSNTDSDSTYSTSKKKRNRKKGGKRKKESESSESDNGKELLKQLDFKKQLIMKKIEEIDFISERCGKNKTKEMKHKNNKKEKDRSEDVDSLKKYMKSLKKKSTSKDEKLKKMSKFSLKSVKSSREFKKDSNSDSSDEDETPQHGKRREKAEGESGSSGSESSDSDSDEEQDIGNKLMGIKSLKKLVRASGKNRKDKRKQYDSSESESGESFKEKRKSKKDLVKGKADDERKIWKDDFLMNNNDQNDCTRLKYNEVRLDWKEEKKKSKSKLKKVKGTDDWEASSCSDESSREIKSRESWDDDVLPKDKKSVKMETLKETSIGNVDLIKSEKDSFEKNSTKFESDSGSNNTKMSVSNFPFKEKSFSGFREEFSEDFFRSQNSLSTTGAGAVSDDSRPFCSITKAVDQVKHSKSELYSPGHSDSETSDVAEPGYKMEKINNSNYSTVKSEVYDPLNSESDTSMENDNGKINNIPLPRGHGSDVAHSEGNNASVDILHISKKSPQTTKIDFHVDVDVNAQDSCNFKFKSTSFSPSEMPFFDSNDFVGERSTGLIKKQVINVKSQPKLKSKAASVFQDDSDDSTFETAEKTKESISNSVEYLEKMRMEEILRKSRSEESDKSRGSKSREEERRFGEFDNYKEKSEAKERKIRNSSRERKSSSSSSRSTRYRSPVSRKKSSTPEVLIKTRGKENRREIRSDSFEIEPLKSATEYKDLEETVQPIPVLTGLGKSSSEQHSWSRSQFLGYTAMELHDITNELIDPSESFDIYPSEESAHENRHFEKVFIPEDKNSGSKTSSRERKSRRWSRSKSSSPRKKRRSKSPEKRRSPRNRSPKKSKSPKRRNKSPHSPRRKSPKKKSPSHRYRSSRSPDRKRISRSRSPRKRRSSPGRRSYSISPHKNQRRDSPSRRRISPSMGYSPCKSVSPRRDEQFSSHYSNSFHNRIPVIGARNESSNHEFSPSNMGISPMGFSHTESNLGDTSINNSFYNRDYAGEFGSMNYQEEIGVGNLITVKNHDMDKRYSPERLSLDQRIEMELGVPMHSHNQNDQYHKQPFQDVNMVHFQNSYENHSGSENFYQNNQNVLPNADFNSQYYNGHHPSQAGYRSFQQYPNSQNSMLQVGNIVEVVPTQQHQQLPPSTANSSKNSCHQIMQVGNVLQVLPSQKSQGSPMPFHNVQNYGSSSGSSMAYPIKTQKATAVVAPSSIMQQPNPDSLINPLIKAIQLEREKRKKEKEKRKAEREARRKARQLRREAKLMSVNEKLKKSVQDEGLMLGQEVEDDELLDGMDLPSPPIPVEIITVTSPSALPPAGKGILITAGFMPKPPSEKKEVKFADGVLPGEGTSTSDGEDIASPPPKPKLPKEKRYKKKKMKVKKKVKVEIIKQVIQDDDPDDDLSPPPPPPGDPPPIYFARYSFAGNAQFPVIQTQTTTTTITTVQCSAPTF